MKASTLLLLLLSPVSFAGQLYYPPLYWHKDDCRFQTLQRSKENNATKEVFMKVIYRNDGLPIEYGMTVVCPTIHMNNWMTEVPDSFSFNENLWRVDKEGYDKCEVNTNGNPKENKLILTCDDKMKINTKNFLFMKTYGFELALEFEEGKHYYFISTSNGEQPELKTRKVSGKDGSCEKHHMKLHIYVCVQSKEDCIYEMPKCGPPPELFREMHLIGGKLPAPTKAPRPKTAPKVRIPRKTEPKKGNQVMKPTTLGDVGEKVPLCKAEDKGTSVHLILNFVLGGVALFMAVVIIILVCGLSDKNKTYEMERPPSAISTTHGGHIVNTELVNAEIVRYSDGHIELSPVIVGRTPPTSPNIIIPPYTTLQRMHSQRQNTPSDNVPNERTPSEQFHLEDTPPDQSPLESPLSNEVAAFTFPDQAKAMDSEGNSDDHESSESSLTTTAIVTNPRHDHEVDT